MHDTVSLFLLQKIYIISTLWVRYSFPLSDSHNLDHKHIVGMIHFPLSHTQNLDHKHTVGIVQFPSF